MTYAGTVHDYYFHYSHGAFFLDGVTHSTQQMREQLTKACMYRKGSLRTGGQCAVPHPRGAPGKNGLRLLLPEVSCYLQHGPDGEVTTLLSGNAHNSLLHFQPIWRAGPNEYSVFILPSPQE